MLRSLTYIGNKDEGDALELILDPDGININMWKSGEFEQGFHMSYEEANLIHVTLGEMLHVWRTERIK